MSIDSNLPRPQSTPKQERERNRQLNFQAEIAAMDRDRSGGVTMEEFLSAQVQGPLARDLDGNGGISWDEFARSHGLDPAKMTTDAQKQEEIYWRAIYSQAMAGRRGEMKAEDLERALSDRFSLTKDDAPSGITGQSVTFGQFAYESRATELATRFGYVNQLMAAVQPGDLVFTKGTGLVADATNGPWTHVALCVEKGPPPKFVEAVGMTGSPGSRGLTRESTFTQFISDTDLAAGGKPDFAIVRPTDDPKRIAEAIRFAREQVGKPYDFAFSTLNDTYYCSELVYAAYNQNPEALSRGGKPTLGLLEDPLRNATITRIKNLLKDHGIDEARAGHLIAKWNGGQKLSALWDAGNLVKDIGKKYTFSHQLRLLLGETEKQGQVTHGFVSPTLLLEGNLNKLAGYFSDDEPLKKD